MFNPDQLVMVSAVYPLATREGVRRTRGCGTGNGTLFLGHALRYDQMRCRFRSGNRRGWTVERRFGYAGGMSDLAYFEYKTVIPAQGSEREGTPAYYLVDVLIKHPVTGEIREEAELKKLANEHLTLVLNLGVVQLPELKPISESEAKKLNMVRSLGARSDSGVFLVE